MKEKMIPVPKAAKEFAAGGAKQQLMRELLNKSRNGQFVDTEKLQIEIDSLFEVADKRQRSQLTEVKFDVGRRIEWIKKDGNDSMAHTSISSNTLNMLARLTELSADNRRFNTISEARKLFFESTVRIKIDPMQSMSTVPATGLKDIMDAIAEFDSLLEDKNA